METINGISVNSLDFKMEYVGVLLFQEFPITTIYSDSNRNPIFKEWVDCDDQIDRYLIYKASKVNFKLFLNSKISHRELFLKSIDDLVYIVDENIKNNETISIKIISTSKIPFDYLPTEDSYFSNENGVETKKIIEYFELNKITINNEGKYIDKVAKIAEREHVDVINLHLKSGKGVYFGSIETEVLAESLISFDELYKETVLDFFFGKNRGVLNRNDRNDKIELSKTIVFDKKAASFSIFLKPKYHSQFLLFEEKTELQKIIENLYELFDISENEKQLNEKYSKYSSFVYKSYKKFLKTLIQNESELELNWVSPTIHNRFTKLFTIKKSDKILRLIENISFEDINKFNVKGRFRAINCNTGYFKFFSLNENEYSGYFDKPLLEGIVLLNFTNLYEVTIERKIKKQIGDEEGKIDDKILAYHEIKENT